MDQEVKVARITVEDCLQYVDNRYALVIMATKRTKQLIKGATPLLVSNVEDKPAVAALREIANGLLIPDQTSNSDETQ